MLKRIDTWLDVERFIREAAEVMEAHENEREVETNTENESEKST